MISSNEANNLRYGELNPYGLDRWKRGRADQLPAQKQVVEVKGGLLVLYNTDPGGLLVVTGAQPDIIGSRETDLDRKMGAGSKPVCMFSLKEVS
jgi:hypothetical protein